MSDIYSILSKHFLGETTPEEAQQVHQFKLENSEEYEMLSKLWKKEGILIKDFDSQKAWKQMGLGKPKSSPKVVSIWPYLKKVASVAAVLLVISFAAYKYFQPTPSELVVLPANDFERNKKVQLPDGTLVFLNKNAQLTYPTAFDGNQREVQLLGEAFFDVSQDSTKPFIIATVHSEVSVLGTSFNINTNSETTEVSVKTGKVKVQSNTTNQSVTLTPNQTAKATSSDLLAYPNKNPNYLAWQTGEFKFQETPIKQVLEDLSAYYDQKIRLTNDEADCQLTVSFNNYDFNDIVEIIQLSCGLEVEEKEGQYELF